MDQLVSGEAAEFFPLDSGSNAYGLGTEATTNGRGMVLGNPHFPWDGAERLYQAHITIPGKLDVSGARLYGVPAVLIGHTRGLAWSHTVASAWRFTPFELQLVPGDPYSYIVDGQVKKMQARTSDGGGARPQTAPSKPRTPHALQHRVRADADLDPRPAAVPMDAAEGLCAWRRQLRELPLPQSLRRHRPGSIRAPVRPHPAHLPGHSLGQQHRRRSPRRGLLLDGWRDPERQRRQGDDVRRVTRGLGLSRHRDPDPRRLARSMQLGHRRRLDRRWHLRTEPDPAPISRRLRHQRQRQPLALQPRAAARRLRARDRRRAHASARCARGSAW